MERSILLKFWIEFREARSRLFLPLDEEEFVEFYLYIICNLIKVQQNACDFFIYNEVNCDKLVNYASMYEDDLLNWIYCSGCKRSK